MVGDQRVCAGGQSMAYMFVIVVQSSNVQEKCWKMAAIAAMVMVKLSCVWIFYFVMEL